MRPEVPATYDTVSRVNHWVIAIAMIGVLGLGLYLEFGGLEREEKGWWRDLHKATGVLVLIYGTWRVGWRLRQGFPDPVGAMPAWQEKVVAFSHWFLLTAILLMPISGVLRTLFGDHSLAFFGLFTIPALGDFAWVSGPASFVHAYMGYALVAVVLLHVAGALKHHLVDRDGTLLRMLNGRGLASRSDRAAVPVRPYADGEDRA